MGGSGKDKSALVKGVDVAGFPPKTLEPGSFFDRMAEVWDEVAIHPPERVREVLKLAGLDSAPGARVLDVGCGTGVLAPWLAAAVGPEGRILAIDLSPRMIAVAKAKRSFANVEYRIGDFCGLRETSGFDALVVYSAFPHFDDHGAFFRQAASLLVDGGRLVIAHIEPREVINSFHENQGPASTVLAPVEELAAEARPYGFRPHLLRDDDLYILVVERL
jgi:2-polyprenyl-3-methyl-5-hydroxy-6-metoxy-1,4-benzoquinol methylase